MVELVDTRDLKSLSCEGVPVRVRPPVPNMKYILITGSCGLIGSETALYFSKKGYGVIGIDNNMRSYFFGEEADNTSTLKDLKEGINNYKHYDLDIRDLESIKSIFKEYGENIFAVVHTAAQPSHDWAKDEPLTDFSINANGTLNLLNLSKIYCPSCSFIFTSTNKVYGDRPNLLPLEEKETRWEISEEHPFRETGIDESMSIDQSKHSLFGASKLAADIMVQEYGRYFNMNTAVFRAGCLTGPAQKGAQLHGFISYLVKCCLNGSKYTILGHKGKQVRDIIHSYDIARAFYCFVKNPKSAQVYNIGGGREMSCSVLEAISLCEKVLEKKLNTSYINKSREGDHIWWITNKSKFELDYPEWSLKYNLEEIIKDIANDKNKKR